MSKKEAKEIKKRRAMTTEAASKVKRSGHNIEYEFAKLIGGEVIVGLEKGDVRDVAGNLHSVKGAEKKWQIFLYGKARFENDFNIPGRKLIIECINSFPGSWAQYKSNKVKYKHVLQPAMRKLKDYLSKAKNSTLFLIKSFLDGKKVKYLTIKEGDIFHVFDGVEAMEKIDAFTSVENSKARTKGQMDDLKVVFKVNEAQKTTIGEIELRTDRFEKFRRVKFWMLRDKTLHLLKSKISSEEKNATRLSHAVKQ